MGLYRHNTSGDRESGNDIGRRYVGLALPRVYCCGMKTLAQETVDFLHRQGLTARRLRRRFIGG